MSTQFRFGIDSLLEEHPDWIQGRRLGLVAHPASVDTGGVPSPERLIREGLRLASLFGPEHGFVGRAGAGEEVGDATHPAWRIPVYSLYGETRKPTPGMLAGVDTILFDLQDLGTRPYTYVSTLRLVLEAAAENGKEVIVLDRPIPLPNCVDGPMREPAFESFVGLIPSPVVYGMTPGETAGWLKEKLGLGGVLRVAPMRGFSRSGGWPLPRDRWIPPSPAIESIESALCFPITVFLEALPALDHGRKTDRPFQTVGAPWLEPQKVLEEVDLSCVSGICLSPCFYRAQTGAYRGMEIPGVNIGIVDPSSLQPVRAGIELIRAIGARHGTDRIWNFPGTRPDFFDKLMGTGTIRLALQDGTSSSGLATILGLGIQSFSRERSPFLLYQ